MGYELCHDRVQQQLPTSDRQVGRGFHFTHTVLCQTNVGPLIADRRFLYPQDEVVFFVSDLVPGKGQQQQQWMDIKKAD